MIKGNSSLVRPFSINLHPANTSENKVPLHRFGVETGSRKYDGNCKIPIWNMGSQYEADILASSCLEKMMFID